MYILEYPVFCSNTGEFMKRVRDMSSHLFVTLYTLSTYPSAHKELRRHLQNPFRKFPCSILDKLKLHCMYMGVEEGPCSKKNKFSLLFKKH